MNNPPPPNFQQQYGAPIHPPPGPPQGSYPQHHGYGPPVNQYPQQRYSEPPGPYPPQQGFDGRPSPGYDPRAVAPGDATRDADALRGAMKGLGTNEAILIAVLSKPDPLHMALIRNTYSQRFNRSLENDITKETSSWFREGLLAILRGPLMQDVHNVHKAIKGLGTKESFLNDVLLGRSNADMRAIKQAYQQTYQHTLEADVKGDLSMKTERLFGMVMTATRAEEWAPVIPE